MRLGPGGIDHDVIGSAKAEAVRPCECQIVDKLGSAKDARSSYERSIGEAGRSRSNALKHVGTDAPGLRSASWTREYKRIHLMVG